MNALISANVLYSRNQVVVAGIGRGGLVDPGAFRIDERLEVFANQGVGDAGIGEFVHVLRRDVVGDGADACVVGQQLGAGLRRVFRHPPTS